MRYAILRSVNERVHDREVMIVSELQQPLTVIVKRISTVRPKHLITCKNDVISWLLSLYVSFCRLFLLFVSDRASGLVS